MMIYSEKSLKMEAKAYDFSLLHILIVISIRCVFGTVSSNVANVNQLSVLS